MVAICESTAPDPPTGNQPINAPRSRSWIPWAGSNRYRLLLSVCQPRSGDTSLALGVSGVFTHNFDRTVFDFCVAKLSPKDFNNKAPGRAAHPGYGGGLAINAEGVQQTSLL